MDLRSFALHRMALHCIDLYWTALHCCASLCITSNFFASLRIALPFAAMASSIKILLKQAGEEAKPVSVNPADTVQQLKQQLQLESVSLRLKGKPLKNSVSLQDAGVEEGSILAVFEMNKPPKRIPDMEPVPGSPQRKGGCDSEIDGSPEFASGNSSRRAAGVRHALTSSR